MHALRPLIWMEPEYPRYWVSVPSINSEALILSRGNRRVTHDETNRIAGVRTNVPIPLLGPRRAFYFEVTIANMGGDQGIEIGLATETHRLNNVLGRDGKSIGYNCSGVGELGVMLRSSTVEDTIGCGLNLNNQQIFFTHNGELMFQCNSELAEERLYPTLCMWSPGSVIQANFGFGFDVDGFLSNQ